MRLVQRRKLHRYVLTTLALAAASSPLLAQDMLMSPGSVCQPTEPRYANRLDYKDGTANARGHIAVTCTLPTMVPRRSMDSVHVRILDEDTRAGKRCQANNLNPVIPAHPTLTYSPYADVVVAEWTGLEEHPVHSVTCELLAGQRLHGLTVYLTPE